jgi:hypothetical protein
MSKNWTFNKVVLVDWGDIVNTLSRTPTAPRLLQFGCLRVVIGALKRCGLTENDLVIIALDSETSWRNDTIAKVRISQNTLAEQSFSATPFYTLAIDKCYSKDIISYAVRYYHDIECIVVAGAVCYEQLDALDNVKLWSLRTKKLKVVKNPTKQLNTVAKDLKFMGSDNLAVVNYQQLVEKTNLLKLPEELEKKIEQSLLTLITPKDYDINSFPFKEKIGLIS